MQIERSLQYVRHLAWFRVDSGAWLGEWIGRIPAPQIPPHLIGDARLMLLNEWQQQVQRYITPSGSPYEVREQRWDLDEWDACPNGGAACIDVTMYAYPLGDFRLARFDAISRTVDFPEQHAFLQLDTPTASIDAAGRSARQVLSKPGRLVADVAGTMFEPVVELLRGNVAKKDGRLVFNPLHPERLPSTIKQAIADPTDGLQTLKELDPAAVPEASNT